MQAEAIAAVSAAVVALTQLVKWSGLETKFAPISVLVLSAVGVGVWNYSHPADAQAFDLFAAWIVVATSAAGVFGFTRASSEAVAAASGRKEDI